MARRRLEEALRASQGIVDENESPFTSLVSKKKIDVPDRNGGVYSLQFSPDGKHLVVGFGNGCCQVFDAVNGQMLKELRSGQRKGLPLTSVCYHPQEYVNGVLYCTGSDGKVMSCNTEKGFSEEVFTEKNEIMTMDFSVDGKMFATGGNDTTVRLYDVKTNKLKFTYHGTNTVVPDSETAFQSARCGRRILALKFHPIEANIFLTGGWDDVVKVWDSRTTNGVVRAFSGPHICGNGLDLKGDLVLTASWTQSDALQVWDYETCKLVKTIPFPASAQGEFLYACQFCDHDIVIAGGSGSNDLKAINMHTNQVVGSIDIGGKTVANVDSTYGGRQIALGGAANFIALGSLK